MGHAPSSIYLTISYLVEWGRWGVDWVGCVSGWNGVEFRNTRGLHFGLVGKEGHTLPYTTPVCHQEGYKVALNSGTMDGPCPFFDLFEYKPV